MGGMAGAFPFAAPRGWREEGAGGMAGGDRNGQGGTEKA